MPPALLDELTIRRYLLGDLGEEDRLEVETLLLEDGTAFDQVAAIEEELIDEYVRGGLSAAERRNLESGFLSSRQGALLADLSRNLDLHASRRPSGGLRSFLRNRLLVALQTEIAVPRYTLALASLAILLIVGGFGWYIRRIQTRNVGGVSEQELREQVTLEQARNEKLAEDLAREQQLRTSTEQELTALRSGNRNDLPTGPSGGGTLIAQLFPGSTRGPGGARKKIVLTASTVRVSFQLDLAGDTHGSYQATVDGGHGQQVLADRLQPRRVDGRKVVILNLPASRLSPGNYGIVLSGQGPNVQYEPAEEYSFSVVRK
ncbi:MAG TPA: hypothetical protein VN345_01400 [Blastocatellia bacterium]|nr:hypothetical protein [Blastocatellia bacterium]